MSSRRWALDTAIQLLAMKLDLLPALCDLHCADDTSLLCRPLSFSLPWGQNKIFHSFCKEDRFVRKKQICTIYLDRMLHTASVSMIVSPLSIHNKLTSFPRACYQKRYQTSAFYHGKTCQAFHYKIGRCVTEHKK